MASSNPVMEHRITWSNSILIDQIIDGSKTATAWHIESALGLDAYNTPLYVGCIYTVYNSEHTPRCKIRITGVDLARWGNIPERVWREDPAISGEVSLAAFIGDHYDFFNQPDESFEFLAIYIVRVEP
ncbi:MAG: ASCH domain-containing protein [Chloroflexota bacterium]